MDLNLNWNGICPFYTSLVRTPDYPESIKRRCNFIDGRIKCRPRRRMGFDYKTVRKEPFVGSEKRVKVVYIAAVKWATKAECASPCGHFMANDTGFSASEAVLSSICAASSQSWRMLRHSFRFLSQIVKVSLSRIVFLFFFFLVVPCFSFWSCL